MDKRAMRAAAAAVVCLVVGSAVAWAQAPPGRPLATVATNTKGVSLDVMSVERKGAILTVKWAVRNEGTSDAPVQYGLIGRHQTTYTLDEDSGTKYYVLTDKEKNSLASEHVYIGSDTYGINQQVKPGETGRFWAKYPAPPPAVKTISLFFTGTEPIEGVAITDK
jgi:hypothetical protein